MCYLCMCSDRYVWLAGFSTFLKEPPPSPSFHSWTGFIPFGMRCSYRFYMSCACFRHIKAPYEYLNMYNFPFLSFFFLSACQIFNICLAVSCEPEQKKEKSQSLGQESRVRGGVVKAAKLPFLLLFDVMASVFSPTLHPLLYDSFSYRKEYDPEVWESVSPVFCNTAVQ